MYRKSYCTTPGIRVDSTCIHGGFGSIRNMLKFYAKVFYVMGMALLGKLTCTQTCLVSLPVQRHMYKRASAVTPV